MQNIAQRVGIYVKQRKRSKGFKTRFFFIDNEFNLLYTSNLAYIEKVIKQSDTIADIITKLQNTKKLNFKNAKVGPLRLFYTIDTIPLANKNCFEMFIENPKEQTVTSLIMFSYQDDQIVYLHDFLKNYPTAVQKTNLAQINPVKKALSAYQEEEKELILSRRETDNSQVSKDDADLKNKFEIISKILSQMGKESDDLKSACEDLLIKQDSTIEETQLLQLSNGNSFSGKMKDGKPFGQGTEFIQDGTSYVGEFRNGKWHGVGYMVNSNLDMTYAEFVHGRPVGI